MTDQFTSLNPAAIREMINHIDASLAVLDRYRIRATVAQLEIRVMLKTIRGQLEKQLRTQEGDGTPDST